MLYHMLKRLIETGNTDSIEEKIEVFYKLNKITQEEYDKLLAMLNEIEVG